VRDEEEWMDESGDEELEEEEEEEEEACKEEAEEEDGFKKKGRIGTFVLCSVVAVDDGRAKKKRPVRVRDDMNIN
jgi:hypothetical protein